ncbi:hypothetical protein T459_28041 [Capsicum annuum]|uniref:Uncharacterized protein n=1 Tax=Capsicum annuum TaxID=4072 RepID=A0A2G2YFM9_CAPAN|nr:hypothetical protein T459_28041 [Capsicum annuum]
MVVRNLHPGVESIIWLDALLRLDINMFEGGVVGYKNGNCHFYDVVGNRLQMGLPVSFQGKKKLTNKTYFPNDSSKVMVTSVDSQVRILCGSNIICKFKGVQNEGDEERSDEEIDLT